MNIFAATDSTAWDAFLAAQQYRPFLQSWTMGEVYNDVGQTPIRLVAKDGEEIVAICFGHTVNARRGKHLSIPYGPVLGDSLSPEKRIEVLKLLSDALKKEAKNHSLAFVRMSPFVPEGALKIDGVNSPLHLLAEHLWYLSLKTQDRWNSNLPTTHYPLPTVSEDALLAAMRKTTRNLIRRAERDGVTIEASKNPNEDLRHFIALHDETRKRHGFTPYTNDFFRAQVKRFAEKNQCTVYMAKFEGNVIAASVHMHAYGETSYHHGASSSEHSKIPASQLLQWTAIKDALRRGDDIYSFWGIAPSITSPEGELKVEKSHPFSGVTLFKTGFGGRLLNLEHCKDVPVTAKYWLTYGFEVVRKWKRGF